MTSQIQYVRTEEEARRLELGTERYEVAGDYVRVIPDFTADMENDLNFLQLPAEIPDPAVFSPFLEQGTQEWASFFESRKVVRRINEDGAMFDSVTTNIADKLLEEPAYGVRAGEVVGKKYQVAHLLTDRDLAVKFRIEGTFKANMRNMAIVNTARAAQALERHVRSFAGYENSQVVVGDYSRSWKAARDSVSYHAARHSDYTVASTAAFIADKVFIYGEQGEDGWRVFGPESMAGIVKKVHKIVQATSCESVIFSLGPELTILDVDVHNGYEVLSPVRRAHAGSHDELPVVPVDSLRSVLPSAHGEVLQALTQACMPLSCSGEDCATVVRVSGLYGIANSHVVDTGAPLTSGGRIVTPVRQLARDMWLVGLRGPATSWKLREPLLNEFVCLVYKRHDVLQSVGPVRVRSVGGETFTTDKAVGMLPGVSGAAVVAVHDFALLGQYDGVSMRAGLCTAFTQQMFTEVCSEADSARLGESGFSHRDSVESNAYERMSAKGLSGVVDHAMESLSPVYDGDEHVGMSFAYGAGWATPCTSASGSVRFGSVPVSPTVDKFGGLMRVEGGAGGVTSPAVVRSPVYGEKVFVLGKDDSGSYCSRGDQRVTTMSASSSDFRVEGLAVAGGSPLIGGFVVATVDGAVLGYVASLVAGSGGLAFAECKDYASVGRSLTVAGYKEVLHTAVPFLTPELWDEGTLRLIEEVKSHTDLKSYNHLANTGLGAMVAYYGSKMWLDSHAKGGGFPNLHSYVGKDVTGRFARHRGVATRSSGTLTGTDVSDQWLQYSVVYVIAAAVYMYERREVFELLCNSIQETPG